MKAVGVVVEYNPFHNGHLYHLNYVKEKYSDHIVIAIMSGNFVQRGEVSILSKWDKTKIALEYGVDIVLDLPFVYANESADFFALNSLKILNHFKVSKIVFGSESGQKDLYYKYANIQLYNDSYNDLVRTFLKQGNNYPTACSNALKSITDEEVNLPNDILGLAYTKAIIAHNMEIDIDVVLRTNNYHGLEIEEISSATSIRNAIVNNAEFDIAVPKYTREVLETSKLFFSDDFYTLLKYRILSSSLEELQKIHLVEEGIENRLKSVVKLHDDYESLTKAIASKRYTYSRVSRMLYNILINYTKEERAAIDNCTYKRVLGFSSKGQGYLKYLKKRGIEFNINIKSIENTISEVEYRASSILSIVESTYHENEKIIE